jgi:hypothetical protein
MLQFGAEVSLIIRNIKSKEKVNSLSEKGLKPHHFWSL